MASPLHHRPRLRVAVSALALSAALILVFGAPGLSLGQRKHKTQAKPPSPVKPAETPVPFRVGEKLDYRVQWSKLVSAATIRLSVAERRPFHGREAWHFQGVAHTIVPMRYLYTLDDQFDSYAEPAALASLQYEMYVREQGKQENAVFRMSAEGDPAPSSGPAVRVLPGTRDPLGLLYYIRALNWQRTKEARSAVFDGKKLYEVRARLEVERGAVSVPAGNYTAYRIDLHVYERGQELAQTRFSVWLAHDAGRTPILLEAELPFGSARVELTHAE